MQEECTVSQTVRYLAKKWTLLIILELYKGQGYTRRFSELKTALGGITQKVLAERLRELEAEGIVTRRVDASSFPLKTEYTLTESGLEIVDVIRGIKAWALKWKVENLACGARDCSVCGL
ncbi:MAG: helix-turn-helix transcriptional regulator [Methanospirillum sp.]|nr:helix-turn-helix transcriptional regulator [Methanospirillum sp.]